LTTAETLELIEIVVWPMVAVFAILVVRPQIARLMSGDYLARVVTSLEWIAGRDWHRSTVSGGALKVRNGTYPSPWNTGAVA
jgi:hypothetical protein